MVIRYFCVLVPVKNRRNIERVRVQTYSIPWPFLKVEYLKTDLTKNNRKYTVVSASSHTSRLVINLSISVYFEMMWHRSDKSFFVIW